MSIETIEREFRKKVSAKVRLVAGGKDRFRVFTLFPFENGDHLSMYSVVQALLKITSTANLSWERRP